MELNNTAFLFIAVAAIIVLIIVCFIMNLINMSKINTLFDYSDDGDIITALKDYYDKVDDLSKTISTATDAATLGRLTSCENAAHISIKNIGIVNFDAFDDVTGNLSFAIAMLDSSFDGIILTSLFGHNSCNTYVREVRNGECSIKLLEEEKEALLKAKHE